MTITIDYSDISFKTEAKTLSPCDLGYNEKSGWTIEGTITEDWYEWVNDFEATHPVYGKLVGNYEHQIIAESQEAHDHFVANHPMDIWDYWDI